MLCPKILSVLAAAFAAVDARAVFKQNDSKDVIADSYIVVLKDGMSTEKFDSHVSWVSSVHSDNVQKRASATKGMKFNYNINGWMGYSGSFDKATLDKILDNKEVC